MDAFVRMNAGTMSPAEFFSPENVRAIMSAAQARSHSAVTDRRIVDDGHL